MKCQNCEKAFNKTDLRPIILFPCCDKICLSCLNQQANQQCIKCSKSFRSKHFLVFSNGELQENEINEKIYLNKYKEICFLDSGSFGCVYIVQSIQNKIM
jgi:hypothetical protein